MGGRLQHSNHKKKEFACSIFNLDRFSVADKCYSNNKTRFSFWHSSNIDEWWWWRWQKLTFEKYAINWLAQSFQGLTQCPFFPLFISGGGGKKTNQALLNNGCWILFFFRQLIWKPYTLKRTTQCDVDYFFCYLHNIKKNHSLSDKNYKSWRSLRMNQLLWFFLLKSVLVLFLFRFASFPIPFILSLCYAFIQ